jgi:hypothetical protein
MSFKNSMMLTAPRIFGLITLLAPDAVQTAWEAEGIVFWPTPREISLNFEQKILSAILDFSDAVRRVVIIGNMMVLLQVPAGKVTLRNNQKKFFFDATRSPTCCFSRTSCITWRKPAPRFDPMSVGRVATGPAGDDCSSGR